MKSLVIRIAMLAFCYFLGLLTAFFLHLMIEGILIPDPCAYHVKKTSKAFDLFYKMTSGEGYHPSPTIFNYVLTIAIGIVLGIFINKQVAKAFNDRQQPI